MNDYHVNKAWFWTRKVQKYVKSKEIDLWGGQNHLLITLNLIIAYRWILRRRVKQSQWFSIWCLEFLVAQVGYVQGGHLYWKVLESTGKYWKPKNTGKYWKVLEIWTNILESTGISVTVLEKIWRSSLKDIFCCWVIIER